MPEETSSYVRVSPIPYDPNVPDLTLHGYVMERLSEREPKEIAIVDAGTQNDEWSCSELLDSVRSLSAALQTTYGLTKGQMVALALPNCAEFVVSFLAVSRCGGVTALVNPGYTVGELENVNRICHPSLWICTPEVAALLDKAGLHPATIVMDAPAGKGSASQWHSVMSSGLPNQFVEPLFNVHEDLVALPFSSGTTGPPKGAMISHRNFVIAFYQFRVCCPYGETDVVLGLLPLFHQFGMFMALTTLAYGSRWISIPKFSFTGLLQAVQTHKITMMPLVPPVAIMLAKLPQTDQYDLSSVNGIICAAAPLGWSVAEKLTDKYGWDVMQGFGMTECLATHFTPRGQQELAGKAGTIGVVLPFFEAKILDCETGKDLPAMGVGELCLRGPMVMKGYLGNPSATAETIDADGWLHTGDLSYYDEDGCFYINGRLKELIKFKGHQVSPSELEHIILKHPEVTDAAVVGVPDEMAGELPRAFVVKRTDSNVTAEDIANFLHGQVSSHKHLRGGVVFVPAIPKSRTGKILRNQLNTLTI